MRLHLGSGGLLLWASLICGCAAQQVNPQRDERPAPSPTRVSAASRLTQDLASVEDLGSPLNALDDVTRRGLDSELARLTEAERKQLQTDPAVAAVRPLLHLVGFGALPVAYERLSIGSAIADEIVVQHFAAGDSQLVDSAPVVNRVAELAARRVIRDALVEQSAEKKWNAPRLLRIANALETLRSWTLLQRTLQQLLEIAPAAESRYRLALALLRLGDLHGARPLLTELTKDEDLVWRERAKEIADAVSVVEQSHTETIEQRIALARAELRLGRLDRSAALLQPVRATVAQHLALAVTVAQVQVGNHLCPGVLPGLGNAPLCAAAWRHANTEGLIAQVALAWQSGQGRDPQAIEAALGLRYVVPLMYRSPGDAATQAKDALSGLSKSLSEVAQSPRFESLAQFARIVERAVLGAGKLDVAERNSWRSEALAGYGKNPGESVAAATLLGLATWLAPSEDVAPLLDAVDPMTLHDSTLLGVWIKLNAASALLNADAARLERSKAQLAGWLQASDVPAEEHGALLLLIAQVEAALEPQNEKKWRTVLHLSGSSESVQGQLQGTVASAVLGQRVVALQRLEQLTQQANVPGSKLEFDTVGKVLILALRGLESKSVTERVTRAREIGALASGSAPGGESAYVQLWAQLWSKRLQLPDARCSGLLCADKLLANPRELRQSMLRLGPSGPMAVRLMERGVLALGNLGLSWSFSFERGLIPVIWVEPRWLLTP